MGEHGIPGDNLSRQTQGFQEVKGGPQFVCLPSHRLWRQDAPVLRRIHPQEMHPARLAGRQRAAQRFAVEGHLAGRRLSGPGLEKRLGDPVQVG